MNSVNVTATTIDGVISTYEGTPNNSETASDLNADKACGFADWVAGTAKDLLGTSCEPDSDFKDVMYVDDTVDPDVWYGGDDDEPLDANGYPTVIELDSKDERM